MSFVAALLAPLALLFPPAAEGDVAPGPVRGQFEPATVAGGFDEGWNQVRIEQRMTIRISPRPTGATPRLPLDGGLLDQDASPRYRERKIGNCLPVAAIAGFQPDGGSRLILFLRNRRIVSATLERSCRARDFYSGFYLTRNSDGQLCVDRDTLLARSGATCELTRLRQLVPMDD
ncbi:MAG: hypothetical protein WCY11_14590 [Novosphingobium sp.]